MKANRLRSKLREGKPAIGILQFITHPAWVEILGFVGFDYIVLDCEHGSLGPYTTTELENLIRAAEISGITPLVRVPENDPVMIARVLDQGAYGVLVPMISNKSDAERAVQSAKYPPQGTRGGCTHTRATQYSFIDFSVYSKYIDEEGFVMLIVESEQGIENLPDILKVEGISAICFGDRDLSLDYGLRGDVNHEKVSRAIRAATSLCMQQGVTVGRPARSIEQANELIREGVRVIQFSDVGILKGQCKEMLSRIERR